MGDSTQPTAAARPRGTIIRGAPHLPRRDDRCAVACRDIVELARPDVADMIDLQIEKAPTAPTGKRHDTDALADVIRTAARAIAVAAAEDRLPERTEATAVQVLGARCGSSGFTLDEVINEVRWCATQMSALLTQKSSDAAELHGTQAVVDARPILRAATTTAARWVQDEGASGYAAAITWKEPQGEQVEAVRRWLDAPAGTELPVVERGDLDGLRAVAVLCASGRDAMRRLEIAAQDAAVLIPTAIDAGMATDPLHRRIVFAGWSRQTWQQASAVLTEIGNRYGLAVRTTVPAPGLRRLGAAYRVLVEGLPRNAARAARPGRITTAAATA